LVPFETFGAPAVRCNPWIELAATEHGGHLGFLGRRPHRFWLDEAIMEWVVGNCAKKIAGQTSGV
jgi:predicted alpha/beta-fold hydrolase